MSSCIALTITFPKTHEGAASIAPRAGLRQSSMPWFRGRRMPAPACLPATASLQRCRLELCCQQSIIDQRMSIKLLRACHPAYSGHHTAGMRLIRISQWRRLLRADARLPDHLAPLVDLAHQKLAQQVRRAATRLHAVIRELLAHVRHRQDLHELGVQPFNDSLGGAPAQRCRTRRSHRNRADLCGSEHR